jgi:hypothetical protein
MLSLLFLALVGRGLSLVELDGHNVENPCPVGLVFDRDSECERVLPSQEDVDGLVVSDFHECVGARAPSLEPCRDRMPERPAGDPARRPGLSWRDRCLGPETDWT